MSLLQAPGDLSTTPLAAILLEAPNTRATGILSVAHGEGQSRVFIREGRPAGAQVAAGFRPLGHILLQAGVAMLAQANQLPQTLLRLFQ